MVPKEGESDDIYININIRDNNICFNNIYYIAKACYLYFTYMMNTTNVTGDHAEISVLSRTQQRQKIVESLPKNIQDSIYPIIKKFHGGKEEDPKDWLSSIEDFVSINSLNLGAAFDLLLHGDAKELWTSFKENHKTPSDVEIRTWFTSKYVKSKSFFQKIDEMSQLRQRLDERYENFAIRVMKLVREVLSASQTEEMIIKEIVTKRMYSEKVRESIAMNPEMSLQEIEKLAVNFENSIDLNDKAEIIAFAETPKIQKPNYAAAVRNKVNLSSQAIIPQPVIKNHDFNVQRQDRIYDRQHGLERTSDRQHGRERRYEPERSVDNMTRPKPTVCMKHIARRIYNKAKGLPEPEYRPLQPGECYCCGESGHIRNNCPLNRCCLICGKGNHFFNNCPLLRNNSRRIQCIHDENNTDDLAYKYDDADNEDIRDPMLNDVGALTYSQDLKSRDYHLNDRRSTVNISSVESLN